MVLEILVKRYLYCTIENQRKKLIQEQKQQERKDRTKRLCKRMGLFESMLPESISLTDEQFQIFLATKIGSEVVYFDKQVFNAS